MRCAYYGNADLTEKEMKAGYERDKDAFVFAAVNNNNLFTKANSESSLKRICWTAT